MTKQPSAPQVKNIHKKSMQQLGGLNEEEKILSPKTAGHFAPFLTIMPHCYETYYHQIEHANATCYLIL
jgi:hypothetical protein